MKLRKLVLVGAMGAIVAAVAKKLQAGQGGSASLWQSAADDASPSTPAPATASAPAASEQLVDNAPAPADTEVGEASDAAAAAEPDLSEMPPPVPSPNHPEANEPPPATPDPLTDPLPEVTGEDQPRP